MCVCDCVLSVAVMIKVLVCVNYAVLTCMRIVCDCVLSVAVMIKVLVCVNCAVLMWTRITTTE